LAPDNRLGSRAAIALDQAKEAALPLLHSPGRRAMPARGRFRGDSTRKADGGWSARWAGQKNRNPENPQPLIRQESINKPGSVPSASLACQHVSLLAFLSDCQEQSRKCLRPLRLGWASAAASELACEVHAP